jgi:hypothetical protein
LWEYKFFFVFKRYVQSYCPNFVDFNFQTLNIVSNGGVFGDELGSCFSHIPPFPVVAAVESHVFDLGETDFIRTGQTIVSMIKLIPNVGKRMTSATPASSNPNAVNCQRK